MIRRVWLQWSCNVLICPTIRGVQFDKTGGVVCFPIMLLVVLACPLCPLVVVHACEWWLVGGGGLIFWLLSGRRSLDLKSISRSFRARYSAVALADSVVAVVFSAVSLLCDIVNLKRSALTTFEGVVLVLTDVFSPFTSQTICLHRFLSDSNFSSEPHSRVTDTSIIHYPLVEDLLASWRLS